MIAAFPNIWIPRRELWRPPLEWLTAGKCRRASANGRIKRQTNGKTPRSTAAAGACNCCACSFAICSTGTPAMVNVDFSGWSACTGCQTSTSSISANISGISLDGSYDLTCYNGVLSGLPPHRAMWIYYELGSFGTLSSPSKTCADPIPVQVFRILLWWHATLSSMTLEAQAIVGTDPYGPSSGSTLFTRTLSTTGKTCQSSFSFTNLITACPTGTSLLVGGMNGTALTTPL